MGRRPWPFAAGISAGSATGCASCAPFRGRSGDKGSRTGFGGRRLEAGGRDLGRHRNAGATGQMTAHCGVEAIVGAPTAGHSTLTNALVGQKVAMVTTKGPTTLHSVIGIAIEGATQLMLVYTPGSLTPQRRLDRAMVAAAWEGAQDADVIALVVDAKAGLRDQVEAILDSLAKRSGVKFLVLNKVDITPKEKLLTLTQRILEKTGFEEIFMVSAASGDGVPDLKRALAARMPEGPWHFPEDQVSDVTTRLLAAEITREKLYLQLHRSEEHR